MRTDLPFEMNPVVYYRVNQNIYDLTLLPEIDLTKIYTKSNVNSEIVITAKRVRFTNDQDQDILQLCDNDTRMIYNQLLTLTKEQDLLILHEMDTIYRNEHPNKKLHELNKSHFKIRRQNLQASQFEEIDDQVIDIRSEMLFKINQKWETKMKKILDDNNQRIPDNIMQDYIMQRIDLIFGVMRNRIFEDRISRLSCSDRMGHVRLYRRRA